MTALNIPQNVEIIFNRISTDIIKELNDLDPYLRNSIIRALTTGFSNAFFEEYKTLEQLEKLTFWDTTEGNSLERWAAVWGITRNPSTIATGFVTFTGIAGSTIPISSSFTAESGSIYTTKTQVQISNNVLSIDLITRVSQRATVTTVLDHELASNMEVTIAGADQSEYNGTFVITVTGLNTFEYDVTGSPTTPATGTITASADYANVEAESSDFGAAQNLDSGSSVFLSSPISGVDTEGFVSFDEIGGGTDIENDDELRSRFLFRIQNPIALFNENAIITQAKTVPGVTRVWVQNVDDLVDSSPAVSLTRAGDFALFEVSGQHGLFDGQVVSITGATPTNYNVTNQKILIVNQSEFGYVVQGAPSTPAGGSPVVNFAVATLGQIRIFFVRDNDDDIIPSESEIQDVLDAVLEIKPMTTSNTDIFVDAPSPVTADFTFSSMTPNTKAMQDAVTANLQSYFASGVSVAQDVKKIDYETVINSAFDSGGNKIQDFTLSTPTTDIEIGVSELVVIGVITFPE